MSDIKCNPIPPKEVLQDTFEYDEEAGRLVWKATGKYAAPLSKTTYRTVKWNGLSYGEHRLIWSWHNGPVPKGKLIDHLDTDKSNNRIENLYPKSNGGNMINRPSFNVPVPNIYPNPWGYRVNLRVDGHLYGKHFKTFEEAVTYRNRLYRLLVPEYLDFVDLDPTDPTLEQR